MQPLTFKPSISLISGMLLCFFIAAFGAIPSVVQAQQRSNAQVTNHSVKTVTPSASLETLVEELELVLVSGNPSELEKLMITDEEMNAVATKYGYSLGNQFQEFKSARDKALSFLEELTTQNITSVQLGSVELRAKQGEPQAFVPELTLISAAGDRIIRLIVMETVTNTIKVLYREN